MEGVCDASVAINICEKNNGLGGLTSMLTWKCSGGAGEETCVVGSRGEGQG